MSTETIGSSGVYEEPRATLFRAARAEVLIDRSAEEVWAILTDLSYSTMKLWNPELANVEHIAGDLAKENALVLVTKDMLATVPKNTKQPPFYMRTVRVVPNRQRVLRIDAVDQSFCAFVDHSLYESDGRTKVVYNGYIETRGVPAAQIKAADSERGVDSVIMDYLNHSFALLKKAVEAQ